MPFLSAHELSVLTSAIQLETEDNKYMWKPRNCNENVEIMRCCEQTEWRMLDYWRHSLVVKIHSDLIASPKVLHRLQWCSCHLSPFQCLGIPDKNLVFWSAFSIDIIPEPMFQDKVLNSTFLPTDKLIIYAFINYYYSVWRQHLSTGILE